MRSGKSLHEQCSLWVTLLLLLLLLYAGRAGCKWRKPWIGASLEVYCGERIEIVRVKTEDKKKREEKHVKVVEDM